MKRVSCLILAAAVTGLGGCATTPEPLQGEFAGFTPAQVSEQQTGARVRWGGVLLKTEPKQDKTCFEVLARPLGRSARPVESGNPLGRFIACKQGFQDPAMFEEGRSITVTGRLADIEPGMIGEYEYQYPVLESADTVYLWPERRNYGGYPYHGRYGFGHGLYGHHGFHGFHGFHHGFHGGFRHYPHHRY